MALLKRHRLSENSTIQRILKKGRPISLESFLVKFTSNQFNFNRFVVIVSLKISKKSAIRNRIKRRVSEIIRLNFLKIKPGYDIVLLAKPGILKKRSEELKEELNKGLNKIFS